VPLRGVLADGVVRLQLSDSFAARAALLLFGETSDPSVRRDIAGELCNMMAGLIAAKIRDEGGPFTLETPSVTAGVRRPIESGGRMISRSDWDCGGEWLTLEILIPEKGHAA